MNAKLKFVLCGMGLFALSKVAPIAVAAECDNLKGKQASTERLIECLTPKPEEELDGRSLTIGGPQKKPQEGFASMPINFEYDSYGLTPDAKSTLNKLGEALQDPTLSQYPFLIEGHTDATGTEEYNRRLSERRAKSVKQYLVDTLGINASRLKTEGRGEEELLDTANPTSGVNRRVKVVNLQ